MAPGQTRAHPLLGADHSPSPWESTVVERRTPKTLITTLSRVAAGPLIFGPILPLSHGRNTTSQLGPVVHTRSVTVY